MVTKFPGWTSASLNELTEARWVIRHQITSLYLYHNIPIVTSVAHFTTMLTNSDSHPREDLQKDQSLYYVFLVLFLPVKFLDWNTSLAKIGHRLEEIGIVVLLKCSRFFLLEVRIFLESKNMSIISLEWMQKSKMVPYS